MEWITGTYFMFKRNRTLFNSRCISHMELFIIAKLPKQLKISLSLSFFFLKACFIEELLAKTFESVP
jgi:hypothetical protein